MPRPNQHQGFSLIELLLALAILGIISAIAIPSFMGQRRRARVIGDALTNARVLSMQMEQFKAEAANYGPAAATATWTFGPTFNAPTLTGFTQNPCPQFRPAGNSKMNFVLQTGTTLNFADGSVVANGNNLTYTVSISESDDATNTVIVVINESQGIWRKPGY